LCVQHCSPGICKMQQKNSIRLQVGQSHCLQRDQRPCLLHNPVRWLPHPTDRKVTSHLPNSRAGFELTAQTLSDTGQEKSIKIDSTPSTKPPKEEMAPRAPRRVATVNLMSIATNPDCVPGQLACQRDLLKLQQYNMHFAAPLYCSKLGFVERAEQPWCVACPVY
jgi:hypothetical protein